jgi:hypothetical protein
MKERKKDNLDRWIEENTSINDWPTFDQRELAITLVEEQQAFLDRTGRREPTKKEEK